MMKCTCTLPCRAGSAPISAIVISMVSALYFNQDVEQAGVEVAWIFTRKEKSLWSAVRPLAQLSQPRLLCA